MTKFQRDLELNWWLARFLWSFQRGAIGVEDAGAEEALEDMDDLVAFGVVGEVGVEDMFYVVTCKGSL